VPNKGYWRGCWNILKEAPSGVYKLKRTCQIVLEKMFPASEDATTGKTRKIPSVTKQTIVLIIGILFVLFCAKTVIYRIAPGYEGVVYSWNGGIEEITLKQGMNFVPPWKSVTPYPISTETVFMSKSSNEGRKTDDSMWVNTKDGKQVNIDVTFAYHMDAANLPHVFIKFRGASAESIEWGYMKNNLYQTINNITSQYSMMELVGAQRPAINAKIFNAFREALAPDGIDIEVCNLSRVEPDQQTLAAIQAVVNAENAKRQAELDKQRAEIEADKAVAVAKGQANAKMLEADSIAYYNAKVQASTSAEVISLEWVKKWNGILPVTMMGGGQGVMINLQAGK